MQRAEALAQGGRRREHRSVLDIRGRARGSAKPEVAECDFPEGI